MGPSDSRYPGTQRATSDPHRVGVEQRLGARPHEGGRRACSETAAKPYRGRGVVVGDWV